ncbi:MAG: HAMP domain-containing histidine kinase [Prevotella sp.]|nr:HAMP domain-containing histidine kinase [Prevotella sp.]
MKKTLLNRTMGRLAVCLTGMLLLLAPAFYLLNTRYYAEDLMDVLDEYGRTGRIVQTIDMERDVAIGLTLQYVLIAVVIGSAVIVTMRFLTKRLWSPFDETLHKIERFRLGKDPAPQFGETDISEFSRLNAAIDNLIQRNIRSYRVQKEFTENASHELQTPIALIRADLDLLLQEDLDERQSDIVNNMYDVTKRLDHLNRSLLLLAKIENNQYENKEEIALGELVESLLPDYDKLFSRSVVFVRSGDPVLEVNRTLLEILVNNLIINALRNSDESAPVNIRIEKTYLRVSNHSAAKPLDADVLFSRFNNPTRRQHGNGLGLAIVKQICDHYRWEIGYDYREGVHAFTVTFAVPRPHRDDASLSGRRSC